MKSGARPAPSPAPDAAPAPRRRLLTRVAVPAALLLGTVAVLGWSSRGFWRPTLTVVAEPVLVRAGAESAGLPPDAPAADGPTPLPMAAMPRGDAVAKAAGWIEPAPYPVYVSALAPGIIESISVLDGQAVGAGIPVAELVKVDAQIALAAAAADVPAKEALLKAARTELERNVAVTAAKAAGAAAFQAQFPQEVAAMEAEVAALADRRDRLQKAARSGAVVEAEVVQQRLAVAAREKALAALRAGGPGRDALAAEARAEADAARSLLGIGTAAAEGELAAAKARLAAAELRLARMTVRAPSAGVVMRLMKSPGDSVEMESIMPRSAQILALYNPRKLQVRVDVPLSLAAKVRVGQACSVVADVLPERAFAGRVARFVHEADLQKNTVQVKVDIENPAPELKPEMLATAQFFAGGGAAAPPGGSVPAGTAGLQQVYIKAQWLTVRHGAHGAVWVARPAEGGFAIAEEAELQLGETSADGFIRVAKGLHPGDRVVVGPWEKMKAGARLQVAD